ncbi:hypothetical protein Plhal304r1_c024g0082021 [Plasmopara halstedii]
MSAIPERYHACVHAQNCRRVKPEVPLARMPALMLRSVHLYG